MKQIYRPFYAPYENFIQNRENKSLKRTLKSFSPAKTGRIIHENVEYINFSSNDYLGLKHHPEIITQSQHALKKYGSGSGASRAVTGSYSFYRNVEEKIAKWKNTQNALIMNGGFQCNASVLPALFDQETLETSPLVFTDKLIHASMHQGCITAGVKQIRFHHNDIDHLKQLLEKYKNDNSPKFILTESIFSMDGDIAPLGKLYQLRDQYEACLIVDEAHAVGIFGQKGEGLAHKADIIIGTCGKALGSFGSYVAADQVIIDYLIQNCKGFIYSTALPPAVISAIDTAIDLTPSMHQERKHVLEIANYFREELSSHGFNCGESKSQIVPLILGDIDKTLNLSEKLKQHGFWATAIRPPTVPPNTSRIRFAFSAVHTKNEVQRLIEVIKL